MEECNTCPSVKKRIKITREMFAQFVKEKKENYDFGKIVYIGEAFDILVEDFNEYLDKKEKNEKAESS